MNKTPVLELKNIKRTYGKGETALHVLSDINLTIHSGEVVALFCPSGSGKSTLLHIAGLLDTPTGGQIFVKGQNATQMNDLGRTTLRRDTMGFVYQAHLLLPDFTALENVMMPNVEMQGVISLNRSSLLLYKANILRRIIAKVVQANAFIPNVSEKISTKSPSKKDNVIIQFVDRCIGNLTMK